jgi:hypothetical protein
MFEDKTVLILGAGASRPYGFSTSGELRALLLGDSDSNEILRQLDFEDPNNTVKTLDSLFRGEVPGMNVQTILTRFRTIFKQSDRVSIDTFIASLPDSIGNKDIAYIAKRAVAAVILACENNSRRLLFGDWYQWLLEFLLQKKADGLKSELLTVITFNYDRSLEFYLWRCFMRSFDLSPSNAQKMVERIRFLHVYGAPGPAKFDVNDGVPYGEILQPGQAANHIALAGPRVDPGTLTSVREAIRDAQRVIFLGFGFWRENFELLHFADDDRNPVQWGSKKIFASRFGLDRSTQIEVDEAVTILQPKAKIEWGGESERLSQYVRSFNPKA